MSYKFEVESGNTVKFPVGGKYCDRDIVVTATGGDVVPEPTTISGINLHDTETDIPNTYILGATVIPYNGWTTTDFIPVEEDKFYLAYSTSVIDARYCSKFNANKEGASAFSALYAAINCTDKNNLIFIAGHDGYLRFSGTNAQINNLEFYEVINFNWEGW
jgi:hypothetical protein